MIVVAAALAAPLVPPLDGGGSGVLDGCTSVPKSGLVASLSAGGARPTGVPVVEGLGGVAFLYGALPTVQVGASLSEVRYGEREPVVHPGHIALSARLQPWSWAAATLSGAMPVARLPHDPPGGLQARVAVGPELGPLRVHVNGVGQLDADLAWDAWAALAVEVPLPFGARVTTGGSIDDTLAWDARTALLFPVDLGAEVRVEGGWGPVAGVEVRLALVLRNGGELARRRRDDHDQDGVVDAVDACPAEYGERADGCPADVLSKVACGCPFDGMSLGQVEDLAREIAALHDQGFLILRVGVESTGDPWQDYEKTRAALALTRAGLEQAGAPPENFGIVALPPKEGGHPMLVIERVTRAAGETILLGNPLTPPAEERSPE